MQSFSFELWNLCHECPHGIHHRLGKYFGLKVTHKNENQYWTSHDYGNVLKDKAELYEEMAHWPLACSKAEKNPTGEHVDYLATRNSGICTVAWMRKLYGSDVVDKMIVDTRTTWRDISTRPLDRHNLLGPESADAVKLAWCYLSDMGIPELRAWQGLIKSMPGCAAEIVPEVDELFRFWRGFLRAFKGENQGSLRSAVMFLRKEAEENPEKAIMRDFARDVLKNSNGKSLADALKGVSVFVHGSESRRHGPTLASISFEMNWAQIRHAVRCMSIFEQKGNKKNALPSGAGGDREVLPQLDYNFVMLEIPELEDEKPIIKAGAKFLGWATELDKRLDVACADLRKVQITCSEPVFSFFQLLETLNAHSSQCTDQMQSPYILKQMRRFLDPEANRLSVCSTVDIQDLLSLRRQHYWREMRAGVAATMHFGDAYEQVALKMLPRIVSVFFFENYDPQFGLWESLQHERFIMDSEQIEIFGDRPPFDLSVDAKSGLKAYHEKKDLFIVGRCWRYNKSKPLFEKETEEIFQRQVTYTTRANAGSSKQSKECRRLLKSYWAKRCAAWKTVEHTEKLRPVPLQEVLKYMRIIQAENPFDDITDEQIDEIMKEVEMVGREASGSISSYLTSQFRDYQEFLNDETKNFETGKWSPKQTNAINVLMDGSWKAHQSSNLGYGGPPIMCHGMDNSYGIGVAFKETDTPKQFRLPTLRKEAKIWGGMLGHYSLYDGKIETLFPESGGHFFHLPDYDWAWIDSHEIAAAHFPFASIEEQVHMLEDFMDENPGITTTVLKLCSQRMRQKFFQYHMDDNKLDPATIAAVRAAVLPGAKCVSYCGDKMEDAAVAAKNKKQAKAAAKDDKLREPRVVENPNAAHGISRHRAVTNYGLYRRSSDELVACAKSHRRAQGLLTDLCRLHWLDGYRPKKVHFAPTCSTDGDVLQNIRNVLLPRVLREFNLEEDDVYLMSKDGLASEMDELLMDDPFAETLKNLPEKPLKSNKRRASIVEKEEPKDAKKSKRSQSAAAVKGVMMKKKNMKGP
eukprot:g12226.t1